MVTKILIIIFLGILARLAVSIYYKTKGKQDVVHKIKSHKISKAKNYRPLSISEQITSDIANDICDGSQGWSAGAQGWSERGDCF